MKKILISLLFVTFVSGAFAEFNKTKIAVLDFLPQGSGHEPDVGKIVAEWLTTILVKEGRFDVVERVLLRKILEEQNLGATGMVDSKTAVTIGKLLGVKVIISGSVVRFKEALEINARIIDVEDSSIIFADSIKEEKKESLKELVTELAYRVVKAFPLEGYIVDIKRPEVTIDLGNQAGVKVGMEFHVFKEGEAIKHPKTGEVLDVKMLRTAKIQITSVLKKIALCKILEESTTHPIEYGQRVQGVTGVLFSKNKNEEKPTEEKNSSKEQTVKQVEKVEFRHEPELSSTTTATFESPYLEMLASTESKRKVQALKYIKKTRSFEPEILDAVEEELQNGYRLKTRDGVFIDAMAWCCVVLGIADKKTYRYLLKEVASHAYHKKVKNYARKYL